MNERTLEFTVVIKADEATLHHVQNQLTGASSNHPVLTKVLPGMIKETLIAAGAANNFEVKLQPSHILNHYQGMGGLSQDVLTEIAEQSHRFKNRHFLLVADDQDGPVFTD